MCWLITVWVLWWGGFGFSIFALKPGGRFVTGSVAVLTVKVWIWLAGNFSKVWFPSWTARRMPRTAGRFSLWGICTFPSLPCTVSAPTPSCSRTWLWWLPTSARFAWLSRCSHSSRPAGNFAVLLVLSFSFFGIEQVFPHSLQLYIQVRAWFSWVTRIFSDWSPVGF